jgi:hypothetical protein
MKLQLGVSAVALMVGLFACAADNPGTLKSGPQVGAKISKSFDVRICNGPDAGDMACLV